MLRYGYKKCILSAERTLNGGVDESWITIVTLLDTYTIAFAVTLLMSSRSNCMNIVDL